VKAELGNTVRICQQFCDRNVALKNRDELQSTIKELEAKKAELQKTTLNESPSGFQKGHTNKRDIGVKVPLRSMIDSILKIE
jgi:hypothetical protein